MKPRDFVFASSIALTPVPGFEPEYGAPQAPRISKLPHTGLFLTFLF